MTHGGGEFILLAYAFGWFVMYHVAVSAISAGVDSGIKSAIGHRYVRETLHEILSESARVPGDRSTSASQAVVGDRLVEQEAGECKEA